MATMTRRHLSGLAFTLAVVAAGTLIGRLLGYKIGFNVVVRCRRGHLFSTIWIPGAKLKALDLGIARVQYCPVGRHWTLVTPVRESTLSEEELRSARDRHDIWLP
jgi:hypothetical protein